MPNEAIRLPSVEVSSSVHYQKTIAVSKTLSLVAGPSWSEQNSGRKPAKLAHAQTALQGSTKVHSIQFTVLVRVLEC